MTRPRLAVTHGECRARFARAADGLAVRNDPIDARGPDGERLAVDSVWVGERRPRAALVVLSGVHGVEGFVGSAVQCALLDRLAASPPAAGTAVLVVHGVNPWGMAWLRRQNESNVDLNRNWQRDAAGAPAGNASLPDNEAYDELHPLLCPHGDTLPSAAALLAAVGALVDERGLAWVRDGITRGQYRHADGWHYGGSRTEQSTATVEQLAGELVGVERAVVIDLHTGHGPHGRLTLLSDQPPGSPQDRVLRELAGAAGDPDPAGDHAAGDHAAGASAAAVEATVGNAAATTGVKSAQIANGIRALLGADRCHATSAEFGTTDDIEQLTATYLESWVRRHGDLTRPEHAAVVRAYWRCFTPDDAAWEAACLGAGAALLDRALRWVGAWSR